MNTAPTTEKQASKISVADVRRINRTLMGGSKEVHATFVGGHPMASIRIYKIRMEAGQPYGCELRSGLWYPLSEIISEQL